MRQAYIKQPVILNYPLSSGQNIRWMLHPHTLPAAAGRQCYTYIIAHRPHVPGRSDPSGRWGRANSAAAAAMSLRLDLRPAAAFL